MTPFAIAALQLEVINKRDNLSHICSEIDELMRVFPWVQMVLLSELATSGMTPDSAQEFPSPVEDTFRALAKRHDIWLVPGSMYERIGDEVYNTASVIAPDGTVIGRYRKIFPFLPYEQGVACGKEPFIFDVPGVGRFGVLICYDLWFPEMVRNLAVQGVEVILHPSLTDTVDREIELSIIRAMAACNQCYVVDVNGLRDGGVGRSLFVGPHGEVLHRAGNAEEKIALEIDIDRVRRSREIGLRGLGQPLKSFRDRSIEFPIYEPGRRHPYLDSLGSLNKPKRELRTRMAPPAHTLDKPSEEK